MAGVASDKPGAGALERAARAGITAETFPASGYPDRGARDGALTEWVEGLGTDLVVLAGYMQLLSPAFVARFSGRIVNVHPALLPSFPGLDAIGQALEHGVRLTGVTVHFVDDGVDSGPIIMQRAVAIPPGRERADLEEEIHRVEHDLYPEAIRMIAEGRVRIDRRNPRLIVIDD